MSLHFPTTACSVLLNLEPTLEARRRSAERLCSLYGRLRQELCFQLSEAVRSAADLEAEWLSLQTGS